MPCRFKNPKALLVSNRKNILLLTNFRSDQQKSMLRFGAMLNIQDPKDEIKIEETFPKPRFLMLKGTKKFKKWCAYIDKFILFPRQINKLLTKKNYNLIHIIDHSNSIYLSKCKNYSIPKLITCHDLIAIRTAQNEFPQAPKTSNSGRYLQRWIKNSLQLGDYFACDSIQSKEDLNRNIPKSKNKSQVIHLGVSSNKKSISFRQNALAAKYNLSQQGYILHVGSSAWYKNREAVLNSFKFICEKNLQHFFKLVMVGPKIQKNEVNCELYEWQKQNKDKVITINSVIENDLQCLYENAKVFLFPSLIEGFGWPPLEASSRNCPVITTRTGAISDILKDSAIYINPNNPNELKNTLLSFLLQAESTTRKVKIPSIEDCGAKYRSLYKKLIN